MSKFFLYYRSDAANPDMGNIIAIVPVHARELENHKFIEVEQEIADLFVVKGESPGNYYVDIPSLEVRYKESLIGSSDEVDCIETFQQIPTIGSEVDVHVRWHPANGAFTVDINRISLSGKGGDISLRFFICGKDDPHQFYGSFQVKVANGETQYEVPYEGDIPADFSLFTIQNFRSYLFESV